MFGIGPSLTLVWSPDGKRLIYSMMNGTPFVIDTDKPWSSQRPQALPPLSEPDTFFEASSCPPMDVSWLVSSFAAMANSSRYRRLSRSIPEVTRGSRISGRSPSWLRDGRRLLLTRGLGQDGAIYLVDSETRKIHPIISVEPNFRARRFFIGRQSLDTISPCKSQEADIWLANPIVEPDFELPVTHSVR